MKLAFICVNYNGKNDTIKWYQSISNLQIESAVLLVVDFTNDFQSDDDRFIVLHSENVGYFGGLNIGIKYLANSFGLFDFIVVGNNDLLFDKSIMALSQLLKSDCYVISPRVTKSNGKEQNPHVKERITSLRRQIHSVIYSSFFVWYFSEIIRHYLFQNGLFRRDQRLSHLESSYIYMGHGSCIILTKNYINKYGTLPQKTFLYGEEAFLRIQLNETAKSANAWYYCPGIRVIHNEHSSTSKIARRELYELKKKSYQIEIKELNQ